MRLRRLTALMLVLGLATPALAQSLPVAYHLVSAATANATLVKAKGTGVPVQLFGMQITNTNAAVRYIKFYDSAIAPTAGSGTIVKSMSLAANGVPNNYVFTPPMQYKNGLAFTLVTGAADNSSAAVAAGEIIVNLDFR